MRILPVMLVAFMTTLVSCGDSPTATTRDVTAGTEFALRVGQTATIDANGVSVELVLLLDKRCPVDFRYICPDYGQGIIDVAFQVDADITAQRMIREVSGSEVSIDHGGWRLTFIDLHPAVRNSDEPINSRDLRARLRLDPVP